MAYKIMNLGPEEYFLSFSQLSENRALKPFAYFCVQHAAPGLNGLLFVENQMLVSQYFSQEGLFLRLL